MANDIITPARIEKRLHDLSKEVDAAHVELVEVESNYNKTKAEYEIAMAKSRINYASKSSPMGKNYTVQEREDMSLIDNADLHAKMGIVDAQVKAARANTQRLKIQVEIARSIGTSVRTSMDLT